MKKIIDPFIDFLPSIDLHGMDRVCARIKTEEFINAFTGTVTEELAKGEKVQLIGFGTFEVTERAERIGRNPKTKEEMIIEASKAPKFKAGKALKDAVNK